MDRVSIKDMTPAERREYMRELGRRGGKKRAQAFTPDYQRAARRKVSSESCRRNGAKGAKRTIELHGYRTLFAACRQKRIENPSPYELVMIGLLSRLGLKFEREYVLGDSLYTLDFYLPDHQVGIEVDGPLHDPGKPETDKIRVRDARKAELCHGLNIALIRIHHSELGALDGVINRISEIAGLSGNPANKGRPSQSPNG